MASTLDVQDPLSDRYLTRLGTRKEYSDCAR